MEQSSNTYKHNDTDRTIWIENDSVGEFLFTFEGHHKVYNLFADYPKALTPEELQIFDEENPYWADFFADRK